MAKEVCRARSLQGVMKAPVCITRMMLQNSADYSVRRLLFLDNSYAIEEYKWKSRWNTQLAPLARRASFPVSFWDSDTFKRRWLGCQVELSSLRTSWRYLAGMATVSLLVSMMSHNMVCFGPITSSNHLSMARGHCLTTALGLPITTKIALNMWSTSRANINALPTYMQAGRSIRFLVCHLSPCWSVTIYGPYFQHPKNINNSPIVIPRVNSEDTIMFSAPELV